MMKRKVNNNNRYAPYGAAVQNPYMSKGPQSGAAEWLGGGGHAMQAPAPPAGFYEVQPGMYQYAPSMYAAGAQQGQFMMPPAMAAAQQAPASGNEMPVSQNSQAKSVAGKIAADARKDALIPLVARGKAAINVATKAIAMAEQFLVKDNINLCCSPFHKNDLDASHEGRSVVFFLKKRVVELKTATTVLNVSHTSKSAKVAGSIAAKIRQHEVIAMQGMGATSVETAINAFVNARRFLKAGKSPYDITFSPQFVTIAAQNGGEAVSCIYFNIQSFNRA